MFKIGTLADWFGLGVIDGIKASEKVGASGVQLYAWNDLNPFEVSDGFLVDVKRTAEDHGQSITALCGELSELRMGGHGLEDPEYNPPKIEYLKKCADEAVKLNCAVVTTHIGVIPEDKGSERWKNLRDACAELAEYGEKNGVWYAIETGPEKIPTLCSFTDEFPNGRIAINYDPANLVMVTWDDEVQGVYTAGKRIIHTHAKDGIHMDYLGPEIVYAMFADGGVDVFETMSKCFKETPLGQGSVRWPEYLKALHDIGYNGFLTIEREVHQDAYKDIKMAVDYLNDVLKDL